MNPAFKLGRQHQKHQQQRHGKGKADSAASLQIILGLTAPLNGNACPLMLGGLGLIEVHGLGHSIARCQFGGQGYGTLAVNPLAVRRIAAHTGLDHGRQGHQFARGCAHIEGIEVLLTAALVQIGLEDDIVFLAILDIGGGLTRSEHGLQHPAHGLSRNA